MHVRSIAVLGALAFLLLAPSEAEAGILVTTKGKTFVGKLDPEKTPACPIDPKNMPEKVEMSWPYKDTVDGPMGRAKWIFRNYEIRWYSVTDDKPTDAYWERYLDDPIDVRWHRARDEYKRGQRQDEAEGFDPIRPDIDLSNEKNRVLSPHPHRFGKAKVNFPDGWNVRNVGNVFIIERPEPGTGGFRPKIHLFETENVPVLISDVVDHVRNTLSKQLEGRDGAKFEVLDRSEPKTVEGGFDVNLYTASALGERKIRTLRRLAFRTEQTYFFAAYAHEDDWAEFESLFKKCRNTLKVEE